MIKLDYLNIKNYKELHRNASAAELVEFAIKRGEANL